MEPPPHHRSSKCRATGVQYLWGKDRDMVKTHRVLGLPSGFGLLSWVTGYKII